MCACARPWPTPPTAQRWRIGSCKAGYPGGRGLPRLNLFGFASLKPELEFMLAQWRANLGIELDLATEEGSKYFERVSQELFYLHIMGWNAEYPDPDYLLRSQINLLGWRNTAFAGLLEAARRTMSQAERLKLYAQADRILIEEVGVLPLFYMQTIQFIKPWVKKFPISPLFNWFWKDVIIEPHW